MKNSQSKKVVFIGFLAASICWFISGIIGIFSKDNSNWIMSLGLGLAFLCLSLIYSNKDRKG